MRVLVLDDNPLYRASIARTLRRLWRDVQVSLAATSTEARLFVAKDQYDVMLVDFFLAPDDEDRTGGAFLLRLRKSGCQTPAVLVSAADDDVLERSAHEAGAEAWLRKSEVSSLRAVVEALRVKGDDASSQDIPEPLKPLVHQVRVLMEERAIAAATADARVAHALALLAQRSLAADRGRRSIVRDCARAVGLRRNTLSEYAPLARWSLERLTSFLTRRNAEGVYLTVWHAIVLATLPDAVLYATLEQVVAENLSVKELKRRLFAQRRGVGVN